MAGTRTLVDNGDPSLTYTTVSTWDLAPPDSDAVLPWPVREGSYDWAFTPRQKGVYRVRASILKTADHGAFGSPWRTFAVK